MKKPVKVLAVIGSVILVLLIVLVVVAKVVITPEKVRNTVLPLAEEQLDRKVDFTGLGVSIFTGITLEGFTIFEAEASERFVALDGLVLRPQILPLFTGRVVVDEVLLERPRIRIVRNADGSFNFSSLGKQEEGSSQPAPVSDAASDKGAGIDLLVASVRIAGGEILYRDHALQPAKPFEVAVNEVEVVATDIALDKRFPVKVDAKVAGAPLALSAMVDPSAATAEGSLTLKGLALKNFKELAGGGYPEHLEPLTLDLDLKGSGSAKQANVAGDIELGLAGQKLIARLDAPSLMASPLPLSIDISATELQLARLLPPETTADAAATGKANTSAAQETSEPGPVDLPIDTKGSVHIKKLAYNALTLDQLAMDWTLVNNVFNLNRMNAGMADGMLRGRAQVDLGRKGFAYQGGFEVAGVQADPLVSAFYPEYRNVVTGGLDLNLDLLGRGTQGDALKRNLSGEGSLKVLEGRISGAPLVEGLAAFLGEDELKVLSFRETQGTFTIKDGKVAFTSRIDGSQARMQPQGTIGLDGGLDVRLDARLNPELTRKIAGRGDFAGALKDEEGWGLFPLRVKGSIDKPRFTLDSKAVKQQVTTKATEKAVEELSKKLFKGDENEKSGESVLKDALKGLLGN